MSTRPVDDHGFRFARVKMVLALGEKAVREAEQSYLRRRNARAFAIPEYMPVIAIPLSAAIH